MKITVLTPKSAGIVIDILAVCIDSKDALPFEDVSKSKELCKKNCPNYKMKWSCPPYAPFYYDISKGYEFLTVCILNVQLNQFDYIDRDYLKIRAAHSILKSRANRMLKVSVSENVKGISAGSCRLCKSCRHKLKEPCRVPDKMMYSFEALGIDVSLMTKKLFDFELQWYSKGRLPEYTSAVVGLLSKEKIDVNNIYSTFEKMS